MTATAPHRAAPWLQTARLWGPRLRVMGVDCRMLPRGGVLPHERAREPLLFAWLACVMGVAPGAVLFVVNLFNQL